jgi:type I restriction enzyme M protein
MQTHLIDTVDMLNISQEEQLISAEALKIIESFPLMDKYKVYQVFADEWLTTSIDLEIIQTEGFESVKKVDPNMVIKKKGDKEEEIQDGWAGRIIPFQIVQDLLLKNDLDYLKSKELRLSDISSEFQDIIESLSEEDKESVLNDDKTTFDTKQIKELIKELDDDSSDNNSLKSKLVRCTKLVNEEKEIKRTIRRLNVELHNKTKETIESLTDENAIKLLINKWIGPVVEAIIKLPDEVISNLANIIENLQTKYETTFSQIAGEIEENEKTLVSLLDELEGEEFDMKGLSELKSLFSKD